MLRCMRSKLVSALSMIRQHPFARFERTLTFRQFPPYAGKIEYLVVLGSNLFCHSDLTLRWRLGGDGDLHQCSPIHPGRLKELNALVLIAEEVGESSGATHSSFHMAGMKQSFVLVVFTSEREWLDCRTAWPWQCPNCLTPLARLCIWRRGRACPPSAASFALASPACCR